MMLAGNLLLMTIFRKGMAMPVQINRMAYGFWPIVFAGSMIVAGLSGCGGASAPAAVSAPAPAKPRELGIHQFVGAAGPSAPFGLVDGTGSQARFSNPGNIAADLSGNLYVADISNNALRKVTAGGVVTTVARPIGSSATSFVAVDGSGNLYLGDGANKVQKITPAGAETTLLLLSDQLYPRALGARVRRMAADNNGNIYIAYEAWRGTNYCSSMGPPTWCEPIYRATLKVSPSGAWVTLAASESTDRYSFDPQNVHPAYNDTAGGIAVDGAGTVYTSDPVNSTITKITAAGVVTTLAGMPRICGETDGVGAAASFCGPADLAVDAGGNVYVHDVGNYTIRKITPSGSVTTVAGTVGKKELALGGLPGSLSTVAGMAIDASGDLVLSVNHGLIKITLP
jgi:hypothetical protein